VAEKKASAPAANEPRVPFGIAELDKMLDGGLLPHRPYLVVGPAGTGKTSLALQFLCEGIRRGEPSLYVTLEDPPNEIRRNHRALGPEIDRVHVFDAIPDVMRYERIPFKDISSVRDVVPFSEVSEEIRQTPEFTSTEVTIAALEQFLRTQTARQGYKRMVVDSLTALQYFCMKGMDPVLGAQTFLRFLSDLRTTTVLTVESPLEGEETPERMLARGEIRMFRWEREGVTVRAIGVEKFRGSSHDSRLHPYRIGPLGIDINLSVTISRDTRDIAEPAYRLAVPGIEAAAAQVAEPAPPTLSTEIRDLVELGVDVSSLRSEAEAALAEANGDHPERSTPHVTRLVSLTSSLATAALIAHAAFAGRSGSDSDVLRRVSERAERSRAGRAPTKLPSPDVLRQELELVVGLLPPAPSPAPATPEGPKSLGLPEDATVPAAEGPPAGPSAEPAVAEAGPLPAPVDATPELPTEGVPSDTGRDVLDEEAEGPAPDEEPRSNRSERMPPTAEGISEPPPLPAFEALRTLRPPRGTSRRPSPAEPSAEVPSPRPLAPPLPEPLPPPVDGDVVLPPAVATAKAPAKRRKRTTTTKATARATAEAPASEAGATAPAPKPRRRVVRRKKAPPVVGATAEPLPPPSEESAAGAPAPPPEPSSPPAGEP
jgi:KaiC/GvpD/RAD55 family RecA-like ATPase